MEKLLLDIWRTFVSQVNASLPRLVAIFQSFSDDVWEAFPLGWIKPTLSPYRVWILDRSVELINSSLDWFEELLGVLPALAAANIVMDQFVLDKKLKQRVMTLDQAALLPVRVIIDFGIRKVNETLPREFNIANTATKLERIWDFVRGKAKNFIKILLGSNWGRVVRLAFLAIKWGQTFGYVILLYRYAQSLRNVDSSDLWFNAKLWNGNKRKKERVRIRRRIGGVAP
jgi:hypothetical protein